MSDVLRKLALCVLVGVIVIILIQAVLGFIARLIVVVALGALVLFLLGAWRRGD